VKVLFVASPRYGSALYRSVLPARMMADAGHDVTHDIAVPADASSYDVVCLQMPDSAGAADLVASLVLDGVRVIIDVDDDLWAQEPDNPAFGHWGGRSGRRAPLVALGDALGQASGVTTTTQKLAGTLRAYAEQVFVVPNVLPDAFWSGVAHEHHEKGVLRIGWSGDASRAADFACMKGALARILADFSSVEVVLCGHMRPEGATFALAAPLLGARVSYVPVAGPAAYPALVASFDIGLAPLAASDFNAAKSDLKVLEYASVGVPCVASDFGPYARHPVALPASDEATFYESVAALVRDHAKRAGEGEKARTWAETRTQATVGPLWQAALEGTWPENSRHAARPTALCAR
jgi:hypothetical protein